MATIKFNSDSSIYASGGFGGDTSCVLTTKSDELNFGGSNTSTTIYFGYRAIDSKSIPTAFNFGNGAAAIYASSFNATSSRELKHNIKKYEESACDLINDVKIVYYVYNNDETEKQRVGFIAEDTDELFAFKTHDGMDINTCIGVLMKAVQELIAKKNKLELEIKELKNKSFKNINQKRE